MPLPRQIKTNAAELKAEKPTESKTPTDIAHDIDEGTTYKRIEDLAGIGPVTAEKLRNLGYKTITDLATARADEVSAEMKTISYSIAKGWVSAAAEAVLLKMTTKSATQYDKEKKAKVIYFHTGSSSVNSLLGRWYCPNCYINVPVAKTCPICKASPAFMGGGIPTTSISGASGRFASGKTQIGNDIIIDAISRFTCPKCYVVLEEGAKCPICSSEAAPVEVVFIETEPDTFHLDRLREICGARRIKQLNWDLVHVCGADQIPTAKAQFLQYKIVQRLLEQGRNIHLVVIDSFTARFRAGYSRSEMLPIRAREFAEHFSLMEYLASKYNLAWYLTLQVIAPPRPEQGLAAKVKYGDSFYPVGGDTLLHSVNNWIGLNQKKTEAWEAVLFDSSWMPRSHAEFQLTDKGLINAVV